MSNKRTLKHTINLVCEELFVESIAASLYGNNRENAESIVCSVLRMRSDFISRISHPEPGMPAKQYYRVLKNDFIAQASEVMDNINNH